MTKQRVTFTLDRSLIMKARQAVKEGAAPSLVSLVVEGLTQAVRRMEQKHGRKFNVRPITLKAGRKTQQPGGTHGTTR